MGSESSPASIICVCVNSEGSREPAREWTLCVLYDVRKMIEQRVYELRYLLSTDISVS